MDPTIKAIKEQKIKAGAVQAMLNSPGWKIIEEELKETGDNLNKKLIKSDDPAKDMMLKAEIRALNQLIEKIVAYAQIKVK